MSNKRRTSGEAFPGAKRYLYYKGHKPYFIYSNYDIREKDPAPRVIGLLVFFLFLLPAAVTSLIVTVSAFKVPKKIDYYRNDRPEFIIEDGIGVLGDEGKLKESMEAFYDTTGIVMAVKTMDNKEWSENYTGLEIYAHELYLNSFPDEAHWLIVYSAPSDDLNSDDWYWEGMQGNRTRSILTEKKAEAFTASLQNRLMLRSKYDVDTAIAVTLDEYRPQMMKMTIDGLRLTLGIIFLLLFSAASVFDFLYMRKAGRVPEEYKNARLCEIRDVFEETCNFCGGVYIIGMHTSCPHCGGAISAHHYVKDDRGKVVDILK